MKPGYGASIFGLFGWKAMLRQIKQNNRKVKSPTQANDGLEWPPRQRR
jgi:hypothetical protein